LERWDVADRTDTDGGTMKQRLQEPKATVVHGTLNCNKYNNYYTPKSEPSCWP